ncbi:hypothetical protein BU23DRAFT_24809 [Bimuria novae-zelandiae CBS 107.79]|uniref:DUF2415 domain-containing protein n=1 Tax=Bimuria novae-zelandiae CBS 107.79 TaxID=1447943 RepID=A0A6A5UR92_9PLEO|nr:hypothetical protein BU23DRAFT_24809 [Bimuria novae-zelandiae CBS 107.79]
MAVDDSLSRDTDTFVLPSKSFYPLKIPIAHYQLRHFISSPEPDLIYYASNRDDPGRDGASDVYCLNATTHTQTKIAELEWEARCTIAGHGYVCVGGADDGHFAAIKVMGFPPTSSTPVDALLPLDFPNRPTLPRPAGLSSLERPDYQKIGDDIVNSISIHKLPAEGDKEEDVVAVLTNNDKTVRIYSLTRKQEVTVLDFPFPMNHATISPDGQFLVAVGDMHNGFFFERNKDKKANIMKNLEGRVESTPPDWTLLHEVCLYVPTGSHIEGYFTTAWSPSGRLCAVGSECGYISIFDTELLERCEYGEDALVKLVSSTRPDLTYGAGAVRTMIFSPAPWDFLIWSEDQARVCVADLRSGVKVKQVLTLDPKDEDTERVEIANFEVEELSDLRREADFIRTYRHTLNADGTDAAANLANDYNDSADRRRLHRQLGVVDSDNDPYGLTATERRVLEALRTTRPRREEPGITSRSVNYFTSSIIEGTRDAEAPPRSTARTQLADTFTEFVSEITRRSTQSSERTVPRRRASLVLRDLSADPLPALDSASETPTHLRGNITGGATTRSPNPITAGLRRDTNETIASTDEAWRTIEAALAHNARATDSGRASAAPELRNELRRLRQLTQMRERLRVAREAHGPLESYNLGVYRRASRNMFDPGLGLRTAGLAMSQDGRTLYCGTEEGIFEFHMNLHQRKGFPAIKPR